jgi:hypothetical protein
MRLICFISLKKNVSKFILLLSFLYTSTPVVAIQNEYKIIGAEKINTTAIEVKFVGNQRMTFDFYGDNIFRIFQDNSDGIIRNPEAIPAAQILVDSPRRAVKGLKLTENSTAISLITSKIEIVLNRKTGLFSVINLLTGKVVMQEIQPVLFEKNKVTITLNEQPEEYFFGGGVQNGRFSHKGKAISIENQNSWTDGGVASPVPYYWSTRGYGFMWHTFKKGKYDFGAFQAGRVKLFHETNYLDIFIMVDDGADMLLSDFYQLTGNPVLLPKFGFYGGHLNAYNRDFWKENTNGILFEDGKKYKESQKDNGGIKESLNGEKGNYQFSARAVVDRYQKHDMPLGWILPNDGYGAGYGQAETLDGNILNLKNFGDYARKHGVEIGLWTQSDLHPKAGISPLLQRDIVKEVRDAGVRVLKTDVAWVGAGYSFGMNGVSDVAHIMSSYGKNARPFIISLDGWAGTQRYAAVWSGDQTGGEWEYIRFHIPTYIGSGLSGQPNITSDMDGIFGGKHPIINMRDFQWKAFTLMQLNMDGWGANEKYPFAFGEPTTSINRLYLKLKSALLPYAYTFAHQAINGVPLIRAMFLEYPNPYTMSSATQYQYMFGPSFLIAPIYQNTKSDAKGNDIRDGIYLPKGEWIDYFSGEKYIGDLILNNFSAPIWKLPVFVKAGAIIPMTKPNNHIGEVDNNLRIYELYPSGKSQMEVYDDDGVSMEYKDNKDVTTLVETNTVSNRKLIITIHPTKGDYNGFVKEKSTELRINVTVKPQKLNVLFGNRKTKLVEASSKDEYMKGKNVYYYDKTPNLNQFATLGSEFSKTVITKNPLLLVKLARVDITAKKTVVIVDGYHYAPTNKSLLSVGPLKAPIAQVVENHIGAYSLMPTWEKVKNADYYEIEFKGMLYSTIKDTALVFDRLSPEENYTFKIRSVNRDGVSAWNSFAAKTKENPLNFAIHGITAEASCLDQADHEISQLFNFLEFGNIWHTKYHINALPFNIIADLHSINQLDKFSYLPRQDAGNGTLLAGRVYYSKDKINWADAGDFKWERSEDMKDFFFKSHPLARYIKLYITESVNGYGSGRKLYVFKLPGTTSSLLGDINSDGKIDNNDLTSYMNYTGLRQGDSDFDGYISKGDINNNKLIDAYDISNVAIQMEDGVSDTRIEKLSGNISIWTAKKNYNAGEEIDIIVKGNDLCSVNAFSFALPYSSEDYEYVGLQSEVLKDMENMTYDRLHTSGVKALYPTFVNIGNKKALNGTCDLCVLKFKAKKQIKFDLKMRDGLLVDKNLNTLSF